MDGVGHVEEELVDPFQVLVVFQPVLRVEDDAGLRHAVDGADHASVEAAFPCGAVVDGVGELDDQPIDVFHLAVVFLPVLGSEDDAGLLQGPDGRVHIRRRRRGDGGVGRRRCPLTTPPARSIIAPSTTARSEASYEAHLNLDPRGHAPAVRPHPARVPI